MQEVVLTQGLYRRDAVFQVIIWFQPNSTRASLKHRVDQGNAAGLIFSEPP